jgi:fatty-acyl-CoA synthase
MQFDESLAPRAANQQPLTPVDFLWRAAAAHPQKSAVIDGERVLSWQEMAALVRRFAGALREQGIKKGDVVSVMAPNCLEMLAAHYAVPMSGGVLNSINTRLDVDSVAYILEHSGAQLLLAHQACRDVVVEALRRMKEPCPVIWICSSPRAGEVGFEAFVETGEPMMETQVSDEWQPICINYTSGTTGRPKGVVYHHRGAYLNALGSVITLGFSHHSRYLWVLPMFHCNGWAHTWSVTAAGGTHVCLERVDPAQIVRTLASERITHMCCAPTVLYMLVSEAGFAKLELEQRVTIGTGGAAPTAKLIADLEAQGLSLVHLYGLTESYGPASYSPEQLGWGELSAQEKSVHLARQGVSHPLASALEVMDENGQPVPADGKAIGEIMLRGNTLMAGYYRDADATEAAFKGGWFHTGDLAVRHPNGHIEIRDRAKDIIISGGENIASIEIESVLQMHPAVLMAAAVAMPDEKWGEVPCAFVEIKATAQGPTESELIELCRGHLARFKVPKKIVFGEIPKTGTGKMLKYLLRKRTVEDKPRAQEDKPRALQDKVRPIPDKPRAPDDKPRTH